MNRRDFLKAAAATALAPSLPVVAAEPARRFFIMASCQQTVLSRSPIGYTDVMCFEISAETAEIAKQIAWKYCPNAHLTCDELDD